jgi:uncharacterized glyoxalase superfamily protein PhnB
MKQNRSLPLGLVVPFLYYEDVPRAIEWLCGAFGFTERLRTPPEPDGSIHLAQLNAGDGGVMLRTKYANAEPRYAGSESRVGGAPQSILVRVEDADAHCTRAREYGARILAEPKDCIFGERQYSAVDPAGNQWTFSQTIADVDPAQWGAVLGDLS